MSCSTQSKKTLSSLSLCPLWLCNCSQLFVAHSYAHRVYIQLFAIINGNTPILGWRFARLLPTFFSVSPVFVYSRSVLVSDCLYTAGGHHQSRRRLPWCSVQCNVGASNSVEHFVLRKGGKGVGILKPIWNRNDSIKDRGAIRRVTGVPPPKVIGIN